MFPARWRDPAVSKMAGAATKPTAAPPPTHRARANSDANWAVCSSQVTCGTNLTLFGPERCAEVRHPPLAWRLLQGVFMRQLFILFAALAWTTTALPRTALAVEGEPLYFSLEVKREGRVVAAPKLLGVEGKPLRVERRQPGASSPDYRLVLFPNQA